ncbi:MAG: hypothetical protein Q8R48_02085, partial [Candidatus Omnitrophota bacterium]|nr:hypothetical protein [Candidatus Omnitrophota bacterium]
MKRYMAMEIGIDWDWTKQSLIRNEGLSRIKESSAKKSILEAADESLGIAKAKATVRTIAIKKRILEIKPGINNIGEGIELSSGKLTSFLKKSDYIHIFAVTIGKKIEEAATRYMDEGDILHGYLLDRIGSFA